MTLLTESPITIESLCDRITPPQEGTLSVTLQQTDHVKVVLFAFGVGQELSEHTASVPAIMQQLSGEASWRLGDQVIEAKTGTWVWMPAHQPHALQAQTPCIMLLTMLTGAGSQTVSCNPA
ncbi:MAG TPA: cupin [Phycisphaerales bacterium]|nr:cupin [Phycisphaerales bacterium]HCD32917.1 cupin [Phycisphaerales bacterium]|tara:strand:- start:1023 stop:1385 length:363 start_codon:yes stop_codon:yes gene_type:complete